MHAGARSLNVSVSRSPLAHTLALVCVCVQGADTHSDGTHTQQHTHVMRWEEEPNRMGAPQCVYVVFEYANERDARARSPRWCGVGFSLPVSWWELCCCSFAAAVCRSLGPCVHKSAVCAQVKAIYLYARACSTYISRLHLLPLMRERTRAYSRQMCVCCVVRRHTSVESARIINNILFDGPCARVSCVRTQSANQAICRLTVSFRVCVCVCVHACARVLCGWVST